MTLAPLVIPEIRGIEGKPGAIAEGCVAPGCSNAAQQRHHLWSRAYLRGQPYEWVEVNGTQMQNTVGLCVACHSAVTGDVGGHRAHIKYDPGLGIFEWWAKGAVTYQDEDADRWFFVGLLDGQALATAQPEAVRIRKQEGLCPECGKPLREKHQHKPGPKRKSATWSMVVPDDEEIGTELLDDWVDQFAALLGFGDAKARLRRYHVISLLMSWAMMNKEQFLSDLEEAEFFGRSD